MNVQQRIKANSVQSTKLSLNKWTVGVFITGLGPKQYTSTGMSPYECMVEVSQLNASIRTKSVYQYWIESISMYGWSFSIKIRDLKTSGLSGH